MNLYQNWRSIKWLRFVKRNLYSANAQTNLLGLSNISTVQGRDPDLGWFGHKAARFIARNYSRTLSAIETNESQIPADGVVLRPDHAFTVRPLYARIFPLAALACLSSL